MTLEEIAAALGDRRIDKVAAKTGLNRSTIAKIRDGRQKNPEYDTVQKLIAYFAGGQ